MRYLAGFFALFCLSAQALAATDVFLISRGIHDEFIGSHKVQTVPREGHKELRFCGKSYWVRPFSVAWTKWEKQLGHKIRLEINQGYGWIVLCKQPTEKVSLQDVGIYSSLEKTMEMGDPDRQINNRFQAIRRTFILRNGMTPEEAEQHINKTFQSRESRLNQLLSEREKEE